MYFIRIILLYNICVEVVIVKMAWIARRGSAVAAMPRSERNHDTAAIGGGDTPQKRRFSESNAEKLCYRKTPIHILRFNKTR